MRPLAELPLQQRRSIRAVLADIDDTLTDDGRLTARAYRALERLKEAGLIVVPVTGRPAGWCDMIARFWPVDAVVGENGAFYFHYDIASRRMIRRYAKCADDRRNDRARLDAIGDEILQSVRGAAIAADQSYREADLAIDFREDVEPLPDADVDRIAAIFRRHGATAKISSIHVNGWFGGYDKLTMSRQLLREIFGIDMDQARSEIAFVGDSPNDAPMFGFFPNAVGVANVHRYHDRLESEPAWVTRKSGGEGFEEFVDFLLAKS
ncbi:MAG: HAD-IIB family hydrolase [Dongiaceae bacterium]